MFHQTDFLMEHETFMFETIIFVLWTDKWVKVFKVGQSKICGRLPFQDV